LDDDDGPRGKLKSVYPRKSLISRDVRTVTGRTGPQDRSRLFQGEVDAKDARILARKWGQVVRQTTGGGVVTVKDWDWTDIDPALLSKLVDFIELLMKTPYVVEVENNTPYEIDELDWIY